VVTTRLSDATVRDQALAAATRLFATRGFDATPLQAIADAIGVTKQAILHHFPSKERLRDAVLEAMVAHFQDVLPRLLVGSTASEDRFDAVLGALRGFFADDPDRGRLLVREALDRPAEVRRLLAGPVRSWVSAIAGYIRDGQAHGRHFADVDPEAYVAHILYFVVAATAAADVSHAAVEPTPAGRARYDRELGRIAKAALFVAPGRGAPKKSKRR
jgi:AcrR family transcriptional regulator